jgi:hypothetical protein
MENQHGEDKIRDPKGYCWGKIKVGTQKDTVGGR